MVKEFITKQYNSLQFPRQNKILNRTDFHCRIASSFKNFIELFLTSDQLFLIPVQRKEDFYKSEICMFYYQSWDNQYYFSKQRAEEHS